MILLAHSLLLLTVGAEPTSAVATSFASGLTLVLAGDDNGPPPGSPYPPPPPLVQDPPLPAPAPSPTPGPQTYPPPPGELPPTSLEGVPPSPYELERPLSPRPPPAPVGDVGTRFLWGIGLHFGGGQDTIDESGTSAPTPPAGPQTSSSSASSGVGGVGLYVRLGAQANDRWGIEGEVAAGTVFVESYLRGALTFDYSPSDVVTFAIGPLVRDDAVEVSCGCGGDVTVSTTSVGGTARLDLHPGFSRGSSGRSAFTIGFIADVGATVGANGFCDGAESFAGSGPAWALYLAMGYMHY